VVGRPQPKLKERKAPPARTPTPLVPSVKTKQPPTPNANFDVERWTLSVRRSVPVYGASVIPNSVAAKGPRWASLWLSFPIAAVPSNLGIALVIQACARHRQQPTPQRRHPEIEDFGAGQAPNGIDDPCCGRRRQEGPSLRIGGPADTPDSPSDPADQGAQDQRRPGETQLEEQEQVPVVDVVDVVVVDPMPPVVKSVDIQQYGGAQAMTEQAIDPGTSIQRLDNLRAFVPVVRF